MAIWFDIESEVFKTSINHTAGSIAFLNIASIMHFTLINKLTYAGVNKATSEKEAKRIRICNILALIGCAYLSVRAVPYFIVFNYFGIFALTAAMTFLSVILLNYRQQYVAAKLFFILLTNGYVVGFAFFFLGGVKAGSQSLIIVAAMAPLLLFDLKQRKFITIGVLISFTSLALLYVADFYFARKPIFSGFLLHLTMIMIAALGTMVSFASAYFFYSLNDIAEKKLEERNEQLRLQTLELQNERNLLKVKSKLVNSDLQMAELIQRRLLPERSPSERIAYYYQPMQGLGGDFINFATLAKGKTGILISDVSGHGVAAAFITLMIKNTMENEKNILLKPHVFLSRLNDVLMEQTIDHFVTAIYGVYDPKDQTFCFSSAGHCPPFVIGRESVKKILPKNTAGPLALQNSKEIAKNKRFLSNKIKLEKNETLFLFTDGISEATPLDKKGQDYERDRLEKVLKTLNNDQPEVFLKKLIHDLTDYRQHSIFDDDICAVVLRA